MKRKPLINSAESALRSIEWRALRVPRFCRSNTATLKILFGFAGRHRAVSLWMFLHLITSISLTRSHRLGRPFFFFFFFFVFPPGLCPPSLG